MVKKDQDLQQVVELKVEDTTCKKFDEEVKEKKVELIVDNYKNQEMVIIENIVEDSIEVKYEDESTTHNPQVLVDLLKMTAQYADFLGVENFNFLINSLLIDVAIKMKANEKNFYGVFQNLIKLQQHSKYSKYLFIWSRRFQISTINSKTSLFQVEGSNVGQNLLFKFCNYIILVFLCNFYYLRFRLFISMFFGCF